MKSPFKFLDSFTKDDREIFFGREKEIEELYRRVFRSKIMLVYGVSGTGKSSLINCGLSNKFNNEDWLPLNIRRGKNMLESMYAAIVAASLTPKSEYSASEIQFKKYVKSLYLDHYRPIFFIFDQFEELFIFGSKEEKSLFVRVIKTLVDSDIQCRFIFVMREEYMASVTEFEKNIPIFFSNRVRIENMDINNAIQAIKGPCKVFNISVEEGFPEALVENLSPGSPDIELTYLQVFLDKIFRLATTDYPPPGGSFGGVDTTSGEGIAFTLDLLKKVGNVSDLLGTFLNEQISLLEDPDSALAVLKSFVSVKGTKRQMNIDDVKDYSQTLGKPIKESVLLEMLQNFVNLRILRDKDQHNRYELRHDSLATKIFEKISGVEKDILEIRQFIEDGYHNWQKRSVLLSSSDLEYIAPYESRLFLSSDLFNFITQSKNQLEKIKTKRRAIFVASTFVLLIVFAGFTVWALIERKTSKKQEIIARGNYYNALSKELVITDPTKALRIAEYACSLDPSENNFQNLVDIYSNNEFYHTFLPTKSWTISAFQVLNRSGNIAISSNRKILIISPQGKILKEPKFELPLNCSFNISPDEKEYLINTYTDTLKIVDDLGHLVSKIFFKANYIRDAFFTPDFKVVITAVNTKTGSGKVRLWSPNGDVTETKDSFSYGFVIPGFSSDTIRFLIEPREFYSWIPSKDFLNKKTLNFPGLVGVNSAQYISNNRIAFLTYDDSMRICNLEGTCLKSLYIGDEKNNGFFGLKVINDLNQFYVRNDKVLKIFNLEGQGISTLKIINSYSYPQYSRIYQELLFLSNNQILSYIPNDLQNELIIKKESKNAYYYSSGNSILENVDTNKYLIRLVADKVEKIPIKYQNDKFYYKVPGNLNVITRFPRRYQPPVNADAIIFNILDGKPLVQLKNLTEIPESIAYSKDESLILSWNKMIFTGEFNDWIWSTFFSLYNRNGDLLRTFPIMSSTYPAIKISSDNRNILSSEKNLAVLWDTAGNQLYKYKGHNTTIGGVDISDDGNYVLTCSYDRIVRLWTRNGKPLKVIQASDYPAISFLPGGSTFQIAERNSVKIFNTNGSLIQKIPSDGNLAIYAPENRLLFYFDKQGVHRTKIKEPIDSFILSNNHKDLSLIDKIEYGILSINDILRLQNPNELYNAGLYFRDNIGKKIDLKEKKYTLNLAEKIFQKGLSFDTLHGPITRRLSELCIIKYEYFETNINSEVEKYFNIMAETNDFNDLVTALNFYVNGINADSTTINFGYPEKAISLGEKLFRLSPTDKIIRTRIASNCSNLSFHLLSFRKHYNNSLVAAKMAVEADSTYQNTYTNLPLAYLFNNKYEEAVKIYQKWKDIPYTDDPSFRTFREAFLGDLDDFERRGKGHPDFAKIRELLKK
jgi:WD40 repeat protein